MRVFGRRPTFERAIRPELPVLYRVARRIVRQEADAEDLVQKCLVRAFRAWASFDGRYLRSWLIKILRNEAIAEGRGLEANADFLPLDKATGEIDSVWDRIEWKLRCDLIIEQLGELSIEHRLPIQLCDVEELSYEEACEALDIPMGTLKSRLCRGRRLLRDRLIGQEGEE
ncbi:MAG: RNA polymerase sigma factor [Armatimonadota bacterium]|nr:RNA polymerase sigma factor [Armatimonadota bacterium]